MFGNDWDSVLSDVVSEKWFIDMIDSVRKEYNSKTIFPLEQNIFNAFRCTPFSNVKVVILGQDPYHGTGEAHGLSFSVREGVPMPPSLANIFKELSEIEMTECAIKCICTNVNRFRQIVKIINKAECYAKANGLNSIDEIIIKEILNDEAADKETVQTAEQV